MLQREIQLTMTQKFEEEQTLVIHHNRITETIGILASWSMNHARIVKAMIACADNGNINAIYLNEDGQIVWESVAMYNDNTKKYEIHS